MTMSLNIAATPARISNPLGMHAGRPHVRYTVSDAAHVGSESDVDGAHGRPSESAVNATLRSRPERVPRLEPRL